MKINRPILITGGSGLGKNLAVAKVLAKEGFQVIHATGNKPTLDFNFEPIERIPDLIINGVEYFELARPRGMSLDMLRVIVGVQLKAPEMPPFNLVAEFTLIQNKKSKLSRLQREYVTTKFYKVYEKK